MWVYGALGERSLKLWTNKNTTRKEWVHISKTERQDYIWAIYSALAYAIFSEIERKISSQFLLFSLHYPRRNYLLTFVGLQKSSLLKMTIAVNHLSYIQSSQTSHILTRLQESWPTEAILEKSKAILTQIQDCWARPEYSSNTLDCCTEVKFQSKCRPSLREFWEQDTVANKNFRWTSILLMFSIRICSRKSPIHQIMGVNGSTGDISETFACEH